MFNRKLPPFQIIERQTYSIMAAARTLRTRRTFPQISGKTSLPDFSDFRTDGLAHGSSIFHSYGESDAARGMQGHVT